MVKQTFKDKVIEEILTMLPQDQKGKLAFLSALAKEGGALNIVRKRVNLVMSLSSYSECMAVVGVLKSIYPTEFEITVEHIKSGVKKGDTSYTVTVPAGFTKQALVDFALVPKDGEFLGFSEEIPDAFLNNKRAAVAYLKGLFVACGNVYVPSVGDDDEKKDGYHFELCLDDEISAASVVALLETLGVSAKINERGSYFLAYLKDKDEILNVFAVMGLGESVLSLKGIIDERETANIINRVTICEAANLDKTFTAASKHLLAIGVIEERDGLDSLTPALKETACARMEYQQASLSELADILGVTKSCLNHRLRKIVEISNLDID